MSNLDEALFDLLTKELSGRQVDSTQVKSVDLTRGRDADGSTALFVRLVLADPPEGTDTWPVDDVQHLRLLVRNAVLQMLHEEQVRWYVSFDSEAAEVATDR